MAQQRGYNNITDDNYYNYWSAIHASSDLYSKITQIYAYNPSKIYDEGFTKKVKQDETSGLGISEILYTARGS